jgi:hypothetical protein
MHAPEYVTTVVPMAPVQDPLGPHVDVVQSVQVCACSVTGASRAVANAICLNSRINRL